MIVAQRKKIPEIFDVIKDHRNVLVLGCGTCVTVCLAGGEREVSIISSALRIASRKKGKRIKVNEYTIERQCDNVFIESAAEEIRKNDAVLSLGCGAGVQAIAERYPDTPVYAGLDTAFLGILESRGVWTEKCMQCGTCILSDFGGICPLTRCAKHMLNGPCGGSRVDRCEIRADQPCAWQLIYKRLKDIGQLDKITKRYPIKDWSNSIDGGSRIIIREDHRI
ncbi:MAG: methylenetetrahydrofolate reductase C-terminal domain-containing protein [Bacteroidota bacterium]